MNEGASSEDAWRQTVGAFGTPEEAAAAFETDLVGALDRRLALIASRLDVWMARHPWGGAAVRVALALPAVAAIAAVGSAVGAVDIALGGFFAFLASYAAVLGGLELLLAFFGSILIAFFLYSVVACRLARPFHLCMESHLGGQLLRGRGVARVRARAPLVGSCASRLRSALGGGHDRSSHHAGSARV